MARKKNIDSNYFENIDTEYKAYILGFIYADGTIYDGRTKDRPNRQKRLTIGFAKEDDYIMNQLLKDVPIAKRNYINKEKWGENWKTMSLTRITNDKLCNDLIAKGCNINKSQVGMIFPTLKDKFISHFIRGFFDGDGFIDHRSKKYNYKRKTSYKLSKKPKGYHHTLRFAFTCTDKDFLLKIAEHLNVKKYSLRSVIRSKRVYTLWIENNTDAVNTAKLLYKNATVYLKRKHQIYLNYNKSISSQALDTSKEGSTTT